jgi:hypothetical protein
VDNCDTVVIDDDAYLEWITTGGGTYEHCDVRIIGLERPPMVSKGMEHVIVCDTVFAGRRFDVHGRTLLMATLDVNNG